MENTDFEYALLNEGHCAALADLYGSIFKKHVSAHYFMRKYGVGKPYAQNCAIVVLAGEKVIGMNGCFLTEIIDSSGKSQLLAAQSCDMFLEARYRKMGITTKLLEYTVAEVKKHQADLIYSFNSDQTNKVFTRLGWENAAPFARFHFPLVPKLVNRLIRKLGFATLQQKRFLKNVNEYVLESPLIALSETKATNELQFGITPAFSATKNEGEYVFLKMMNTTFVLKFGTGISVGYCSSTDSEELKEAIKIIQRAGKKAGFEELVFQAHENGKLYAQLKTLGKAQSSFSISLLTLSEKGKEFRDVELPYLAMDAF